MAWRQDDREEACRGGHARSRAGGKWIERDEDGIETQRGKVLAWEPPSRLLLGWQLNSSFTYDPDLLTEVEVMGVATLAGNAGKARTLHSRPSTL